MACRMPFWLLAVQIVLFCAPIVSSEGIDEAAILVTFKESLQNTTALQNWDESVRLCNGNTSTWKGVICLNGNLTALKLQGLGLHGEIDVDSLSLLQNLHQFSVANNNFAGAIPDVMKLAGLRALYLSNNRFSGDIPDNAFSGLKGIRRVILANNEFTGKIPKSLTKLPKLVDLQLQNNQFEDEIPDFRQANLTVNLANNKLEGQIPAGLRNQNSSSFLGNGLCGQPLEPCKSKKKISKIAMAAIAVAGVAFVALIFAFCILNRSRARPSKYEKSTVENLHKRQAGHKGDKKNAWVPEKKTEQGGTLYFVRDDRQRFEMEDLLRASAQVLGSGNFGSSYKAEFLGGPTVAVKRFKQMSNVGKEEFFEHMRRLGRLQHPNLLPLVAFYYRREEKLLVFDFVGYGSLASHLHSKRSPNQPGLDWPTRLKIIKGVAKGLDYLYKELPELTLPHGHLKSSNILLDNKFEPVVADYALAPVINKDHAQQFMVAYKSPERDVLTRKTDIWSLGILILELLTGKFPANYLKQGKGANADLAAWVNSVVREEWTGEVFDKDMNATKNGEGQMLKLLKIGMCCCEWNVEKRWDLDVAIEKIEELKERDSDEEYSSYWSEGYMHSSRGMIDDDFSFSAAERSLIV